MNALIKGGDKLSRFLSEVEKHTDVEKTVQVGFLEGATYPDGTPVGAVAAWQEFGTRGIPSRPFFRNMLAEHQGEWGETAAKLLKDNDYDVEKVLGLMGMGIKGQLQESIIRLLDPPLSAVTLMLRMMRKQNPDLHVTGRTVGEAAARVAAGERATGVSTKPLVDTGHLLNSVDYQVKDA